VSITDVFNDHARRIAQITMLWAQGWISDKERFRYEVYETEITEDLFAQAFNEVHY
jgi:hypothetical protein